MRRILVVLTVRTALVSASAVVDGPMAARAVRRAAVVGGESDQAADVFARCSRWLLALTSPGLRRAYTARSVIGVLRARGIRHVAVQPRSGADADGQPVMYRGPYALLMYLPGFNSLRVPARFWMTVTLCLAVVGAMVFARLTERFGPHAGWRPRRSWSLGVLADTWMSAMPLADTPKPFAALSCARRATGPIVELPLGDTYPDVAAMYRQMSHGRPVVNGYSGYFPPHYARAAIRADAARSRRADATCGARRDRRHRRSRAGSRTGVG